MSLGFEPNNLDLVAGGSGHGGRHEVRMTDGQVNRLAEDDRRPQTQLKETGPVRRGGGRCERGGRVDGRVFDRALFVWVDVVPQHHAGDVRHDDRLGGAVQEQRRNQRGGKSCGARDRDSSPSDSHPLPHYRF